MLKEFLNKFKFKFIFKSSTEIIKRHFLISLIRVAEKYEEIMNIILPTLEKKEEKRTVHSCPFVQKQE